MTKPEPLSVVILTKDEAANLPDCLDATLPQMREGDEVIVVDSASRDATVPLAEGYAQRDPRVRVKAYPMNVSFGAARNAGIEMARHDLIVFVSADATPEPGWLDAIRKAARNADIVYGRQRHAPPLANAATVSRGLRYRHFEVVTDGLPERYASNVNAAYRRFAFDTMRFDEQAQGAEDVAFAKEARLAGLRIAYAPEAIVRHKDVASWRGEWRKHQREGAAHAQLHRLLGAPKGHLAWAVAVAGMGLIFAVSGNPLVLAGTILVFFAPTIRRLASPVARKYRPIPLLKGAAASPLFDLAFVGSYIKRRIAHA